MTFGTSGAPAQDTINLDALLSTSLFNYNKTMVDNISKQHAFMDKIKAKMSGKPGSIAHKQNLLYAISEGDTYSGYDEIPLMPTDGITQSTWEWRNYANSIIISGDEERKNTGGMEDLLETKIMQVELGAAEFFAKYFQQGNKAKNSSSTIETNYINTNNGSQFIDPLAKLVSFDPTTATEVGGLNQNTHDWWRNKTMTSGAVTEKAFLLEMDRMCNTLSLGVGGKPDLIVVDQLTYELWRSAYYTKYNRDADSMNDYPFPNFKFNGTPVTWDDKVCDVYSGTTNTDTYGTAYFLNSKFFTPYYMNGMNFKNEPFQKPANQDAKSSLILWSGLIACSNRSKQGVVGKIARTLS